VSIKIPASIKHDMSKPVFCIINYCFKDNNSWGDYFYAVTG